MIRRSSGLGTVGIQEKDRSSTRDGASVRGQQETERGQRGRAETTGRSAKIAAVASGRVGMLSPLHGQTTLQQQLQGVEEGLLHLPGGLANADILKNLSVQDIRDLRMVFDAFDTDSSGRVDERELRRAMRSLGFKTSRKAIHDMIADVDLDGSGQLDFEEFLQCVIAHQGDSRDMHAEIMHGFHLFDVEHKGKITLDDLRRACDQTGEKLTDQDLQEMIDEADRDGDNAVSKQEFVNIMLRTNLFL